MPNSGTQGLDMIVWMPSSNGVFLTSTAWEVVRKRGQELPWHDWFWHQLLPKRISLACGKFSLTVCLWMLGFKVKVCLLPLHVIVVIKDA